ncbi:MAG: DUF2304 family protein [Patescibacteria group bacterium]|jgi:hypothetical protein
MLQQLLALIVIAFFITRLFQQKRRQAINPGEFKLWLGFWLLALLAIIFIRRLDAWLTIGLGFSSGAISFLVYLVVLALIYQVFRLRLKIAKLDKNISDLNQAISLNKHQSS